MRGREGILSMPKAEFHLREARDLSHCSGVVNDKDMVEDGQ